MHDGTDFAAVLAVFCIFGLPIVWAISSRWMAHQERMAMISRGMAPPPDARRMRGAAGYTAPPPPQTGAAHVSYDYAQYQANRMLHKGIIVGMIGLAITIGLSFIDIGRPGPWLLGGLIPLFIGVAQIVIAMMSGASVPVSRHIPPPLGQPSAPPPGTYQAPPRDVTPGPYAWRPGATTELEKPPSPPEQR